MVSSPPTALALQIQVGDEFPQLTASQQRLLDQNLSILVEGDFEARWQASKHLVKLGAGVIPDLFRLLQGPVPELGPDFGPELCDQYLDLGLEASEDDADAADFSDSADLLERQWFIARILGELRHPAAVDILVTLVHQSDAEISAIAALSLAQAGELALPALEALLADELTRLSAVQALGQMGLSCAIAPLLQVVQDQNPEVRAAAIQALVAFRDERIPSVLKTALADPVSQVRLAALAGIGGAARQKHGAELVNLVIPLLKDLNLEVALQATIVLGKLRQPQAISALMSLVEEPLIPSSLRTQALRALAWYESEPALMALAQLLQSLLAQEEGELTSAEIQSMRLEAVRRLGRIESRSLQPLATEVLVSALAQIEESGQESIKQEASQRDSVIKEPIIRLETNVLEVQSAIALGLAQLGSPQAFEHLIPLLTIPSNTLRWHLLAALKRLEPERGPSRLRIRRGQADSVLAQGIDFVLAEWESPQ